MSLFKLDKTYFDTFKVLAKPVRSFASSSASGATGSIKVFAQTSLGMKEVPTPGSETEFVADSLETLRMEANLGFRSASAADTVYTGSSALQAYMEAVNSASYSTKMQKKVEILRFEPSFKFTSDTVRKQVIENTLFPFYHVAYGTSCNWAFSNYHTLNFFTTADDSVPTGSVLLCLCTLHHRRTISRRHIVHQDHFRSNFISTLDIATLQRTAFIRLEPYFICQVAMRFLLFRDQALDLMV